MIQTGISTTTYRTITLLGAVLGVAACSSSLQPEMADTANIKPQLTWHASSTTPIEVSTDKEEYRKGDPISLKVKNNSDFILGMGPCIDLERKGSDGWKPVYEKLPCALIRLTVNTGESLTQPGPATKDLLPGEYRLVVRDVLPHITDRETEKIFINDSIGTVSVTELKSIQVSSNSFRIR